MSNIALFSGAAVPAFVKTAELSPLAKALAGGGQTGKRISIKGGVFRLVVDGKEVTAIDERFLDTVIVNASEKIGRTYYSANFDSDNPAAPDCWSANGDTPDASIASPQHTNCADCPQNAKGSGTGDSRACRFSQRLAVVLANDVEGDVMQLQVPATSLFGQAEGENHPLQSYARVLAAQNVSPDMVITRMKFDTKSESPKLFFKPMRWLSDEEYAAVKEQGKSPDAIKAITMTVAAMDKVAPKTTALPGQRPAAAPAPAPVQQAPSKPAAAPVAASSDEDPPAPPPRRGRPPGSKNGSGAAAQAAAPAASNGTVGAVSKPSPAAIARAAAEAAMKAAAEAEAAEAAEAAAQEEEAPPVVKPSVKPAINPATASSLAQLASQWDDE